MVTKLNPSCDGTCNSIEPHPGHNAASETQQGLVETSFMLSPKVLPLKVPADAESHLSV